MSRAPEQVGRDDRAMRRMLRNSVRPGFLPVMSRKAMVRIRERSWRANTDPLRWAEQHAEPADTLARSLDPALWEEAVQAGEELRLRGEQILRPLGVDLGGGGHYPLLHFLVRYLRPEVVVETGVAAGYSSRSVLRALHRNGTGHLYSSDFPYFRLGDPQRYIGVLVEEELRYRWTLHTRGDRVNLPQILSSVDGVDLFHYDSDKPVDGRRFAMKLVAPRLRAGSVVLMDDIQDNDFFRRHVESLGLDFHVFEFGAKYLGALGIANRKVADAAQHSQPTG